MSLRTQTLIICLALAAATTAPAASKGIAHWSKQEVLSALMRNGIPVPGRSIVEATDLCTLSIEGSRYHVIDLIESISGKGEPHGYRRALVLKPDLTLVQVFPYYPPVRPLSCHSNILKFSGPVEIDNTLPEGTRIKFFNGAADAEVISTH